MERGFKFMFVLFYRLRDYIFIILLDFFKGIFVCGLCVSESRVFCINILDVKILILGERN